MTVLQADRRNAPGRVLVLSDRHRVALQRLLDDDPLVNAIASARLQATRSLLPARLGCTAVGVGDTDGLAAAAFSGANLVPIGGDPGSWRLLANYLAVEPRRCTSIVGDAGCVLDIWPRLAPAWGPARAVRASQPLLALARDAQVVDDPRLRVLVPEQIDAYLPAAAAMFTEELGVAPNIAREASGYRRRAEHLLSAGRAFGIVDGTGAIVFKADIGALTPRTCQIQGVWVRPDHRGRGLGRAGMSAVLLRALTLAPTASLYVNDYNVVARALYASLGMQQVGELATVLF